MLVLYDMTIVVEGEVRISKLFHERKPRLRTFFFLRLNGMMTTVYYRVATFFPGILSMNE